jgi:hypothetical protein
MVVRSEALRIDSSLIFPINKSVQVLNPSFFHQRPGLMCLIRRYRNVILKIGEVGVVNTADDTSNSESHPQHPPFSHHNPIQPTTSNSSGCDHCFCMSRSDSTSPFLGISVH